MKADQELHSLWDKLFKVITNTYPQEVLRFICDSPEVKYGDQPFKRVVAKYSKLTPRKDQVVCEL
jgi:hypothetical protein